MSINDKINLLEIYIFILYLFFFLIFKRSHFWNKCKSEITTQPKHSNLHYMNDPIFRNTNRLFILSFKNGDDDLREIVLISVTHHFHALIDNKPFFGQPVNDKQKTYENLKRFQEMMAAQQKTY